MRHFLLALAILLVAGPAAAQISVRSSLSDDREAIPGTSYTGVAEIWNETDEFQQAKVYQTDYRFFSDGTNVYGDPGLDQRSNANWIRLTTGTITLPPHSRVPVTYLVEVPDSLEGNSVSGTYWSMIMVEGIPEESPESTINPETGEVQYPVLQIMRYGIQVATHIEGTGQTELAMPAGELELLDDGEVALRVDIENTGSRLIRPDVWVEIYGEDGTAFGRRDGVMSRIYPGTSIRQKIRLGSLKPGNYRALVILDGGGDQVFGAEYQLALN